MKKILRMKICNIILVLIIVSLAMGGAAFAADGTGKALDLNSATVKELSKLPGLGKKKAEAIIVYRDENGKFNNIDELKKVKGIGKKTLEKLRTYVTVKGS